MLKWAVLNDSEGMFRTMRRTGSFMVREGDQVKILGLGFGTSEVRVLGMLDPDDGVIHAYPEDKRIGHECWTATEAVGQ
jgi:hypothetical protein